ncbi:MAG: right-handed parallel beta-helix repeat-containing protein [Candidatus Bathyarchaeota archaeon]|nr:right-handed parallel beta-helix repeat-containing protein [Candidatus Bathyarchaeota archaeon]
MRLWAPAVTVSLALLCLSLILLPLSNAASAQVQGATYIRNDGSVEGTGLGSIQRSGSVYTFVGNVSGKLVVEKDNIVIDGAGFTLKGDDGRCVVLTQRVNVTVKNLVMTLDGGYTVDMDYASNCTLSDNVLIGTPEPIPDLPPPTRLTGPIGINLLKAENNVFENNSITNCFNALSIGWSNGTVVLGNKIYDSIVGIELQSAQGSVLKRNSMFNCSEGLSVRVYSTYSYGNDVDPSNTVEGQPIYYWVNAHDQTVPFDAAYVVLVNCTNILVPDMSPKGVVAISCTNCTVSNVIITTRGEAISLLNCSRVNIVDCVVELQAIGIGLDGSSNNVITGCVIANCSTRGVRFAASNNNTIVNNNFEGNSYALAAFQDSPSIGNLITKNRFTENGFAISTMGGSTISENEFVGNDQAILCSSGSNTISDNNLTNNGYAIILQTTNNVLRNNRLSNNTEALQISAACFQNDVDSSNTLNGKPIYYWVNRHNETVPGDAGYVALVNCTEVTVQGLILTDQANGILMAFTTNSTITGNLITGNVNGIYFYGSTGNRIFGNNITDNGCAVYIHGATFTFMIITSYTPSSGNIFYGNNFVGNNNTLYDVAGVYSIQGSPPSANIWDNGAEGNYWSDYTGVDSNGDGVGDTRYVVYANNTDNYPLVQPVPISVIPEFPAGTLLLTVLFVFVAVAVICKRTSLRTAKQDGALS